MILDLKKYFQPPHLLNIVYFKHCIYFLLILKLTQAQH